MEESKFYRFCRMQNLRVAVEKTQLPDGAHDIVPIFNKFYHGHNRGTLQDEMGRQEPQKHRSREKYPPADSVMKFIEAWVQKGKENSRILPPKVTIIPREDRFGQRFEPHVPGNNRVIFTEGRDSDLLTNFPGVGTICAIFLHLGKPHVVVQQFRQLTADNAAHDPFRRLPSAGYLVCDAYEKEWKVICFSNVRSHFVKTHLPKSVSNDLGIQHPVFHVLPLPGE